MGIAGAMAVPRAAEQWVVPLVVACLVALLGFGFAIRGWGLIVVALIGLTLSYRASVQEERLYRESPWMRQAVRRVARAEDEPSALKGDLSRRIGLGVEYEPKTVALNRAILLGERQRLSPGLKQVFVDSGAIHIFAISGLHVMVIAKIFMALLSFVFVSLRWQGLVALPFLWGYVVLIGSPPSAVRAALMASFYFGASVFWRRPNGIIAWALAFLSIHLVLPHQLTNVGSLFSFVVMLALVLTGRVVRLPRGFAGQLVILTMVSWMAGVPIAAAAFGRVTPGGLLANLMLVTTVIYSVVSGGIGLLASYVCEPLAVHFNNLALLVTDAMVGIASAVSRLPYASVAIPRWGGWECLGWYLAMGLALYLIHHIQSRRACSL